MIRAAIPLLLTLLLLAGAPGCGRPPATGESGPTPSDAVGGGWAPPDLGLPRPSVDTPSLEAFSALAREFKLTLRPVMRGYHGRSKIPRDRWIRESEAAVTRLERIVATMNLTARGLKHPSARRLYGVCVRYYGESVDAARDLRAAAIAGDERLQARAVRDLGRASRGLLTHMLGMARKLPPAYR